MRFQYHLASSRCSAKPRAKSRVVIGALADTLTRLGWTKTSRFLGHDSPIAGCVCEWPPKSSAGPRTYPFPFYLERRHSCRLFARNDSPRRSGQECPRSNARAPKNDAGFSFLHFHTLAILTAAPKSGCARPSLRFDSWRSLHKLTDLRAGRTGSRCFAARCPGKGSRGTPSGRRTPNCSTRRRGAREMGLNSTRDLGDLSRAKNCNTCLNTNPSTTPTHSLPCHTGHSR